ncbi:MAG: hypothetical protein ACLUE1_00175 [Adlercreutzia equolifaciens]
MESTNTSRPTASVTAWLEKGDERWEGARPRSSHQWVSVLMMAEDDEMSNDDTVEMDAPRIMMAMPASTGGSDAG